MVRRARRPAKREGAPGSEVAAEVGARLRTLRELEGYSQRLLAAEAGVAKSTLSEIEAGKGNPSLATLYCLATALDHRLSEVMAHTRFEIDRLVDTCGTLTEAQIRELRIAAERMRDP